MRIVRAPCSRQGAVTAGCTACARAVDIEHRARQDAARRRGKKRRRRRPPRADAKAQRVEQLRRTLAMRDVAASAQKELREERAASYSTDKVQRAVREFLPHALAWSRPGERVAHAGSRERLRLQRRLAALQRQMLAPSTWVKYAYAWVRARTWLYEQLREAGEPQTIQAISNDPRLVALFLVHLYDTKQSEAAICTAIAAINFCLRLHGFGSISDIADVITVRRAAALLLKKAPRPKVPLLADEMRTLMAAACEKGRSLEQRVAAAAAGLMFDLCLRYSDMARIRVKDVYVVKGGLMVAVAWRKNRQHCRPLWLPLNRTTKQGTHALLLQTLRERGFTVPDVGKITSPRGETTSAKLWPFMQRTSARGKRPYTFKLREVTRSSPEIDGKVVDNYTPFVRLFKQMIADDLDYGPELRAMFNTHSERKGADLHRFLNGMSQEVRMELGDWKTPGVEASYRACNYRRRMQMAAGFQL